MHNEILVNDDSDPMKPKKNKFCPERYLLNLFRKAGYQVTPEPDISPELAVHQERVKIANEIRQQMRLAGLHAIIGTEIVEQPSIDASIFIDGTFDDEEWLARQRVLFQSPDVQRLLVLFRNADSSPSSAEASSEAL